MKFKIGKFIEAEELLTPGRKTRTWSITNGRALLGEVKWFGAWRCYGFFPRPSTVFEQACLSDLSEFCRDQTMAHREAKKIHQT